MVRIERTVTEKGDRLIACRDIEAQGIVYRLPVQRETGVPSYRTIQTGPGSHVDDLECLAYLNHSCRPNTRILFSQGQLLVEALCRIGCGEELTFFYPSTEWDMARPFACHCQATTCLGRIAGAKYLPPDVRARYYLSPHIHLLYLRG